ncbi:MAG: VWA domain-containing protein, partial [Chitinispirillaceae bacterium]|nr:VWA domain-containing protein [Chitinispirillaceae bacterium]
SEVERYIPPQKGRNHVLYVIRELLYFKPEHAGTDIDKALQFLNRVQTKRSVVFLVSDFFSPSFETALRVSSRRHDLIACTVSDPREKEFPDVGLVELEDAESGETILVDSGSAAFRSHYAKTMRTRREGVSLIFTSNGIDEIAISTGSEYVDELIKFFRKREKMLGR